MWDMIWVLSSIGCGIVACLALMIAWAFVADFLERNLGENYPIIVGGILLAIFLVLSIVLAPISYFMKNRNQTQEVEKSQ